MDNAAGTRGRGRYTGDLSRRVAHRRAELRLSVDDVAQRAGMAPEYVSYLEHNPPNLSQQALARLALALNTTVGELLGTETDRPPGHASTYLKAPAVELLSPETCMDLMRPGGVGRVAFMVAEGDSPEVLPVNYAVVDNEIVFRTAVDGFIAAALPARVSFQADRLHGVFSQGWSVLIKGDARVVGDPAERDDLASVNIRPWVGAAPGAHVVVTPTQLTGRRIVSGEPQ
ncbi:pyridoxamine 5'-phosphate oxidase family protein [Lipingzhangella sp. LS1_29]|uniref:Pyridoxamine 5'-phosphate oxidase family protein n=1 Tax=Lipingzhangella rawalii TaxID=2055835 RepID=A0ABU2H7Z6_9ACTN|nr:pyridoxamine 5'-phosphate oxidase family protein [Lipingzhangella rawalii]MDS1270709.1 pyridoxamine 5'-phosphate oxidase family protein [Lipingzhangella rawalii]